MFCNRCYKFVETKTEPEKYRFGGELTFLNDFHKRESVRRVFVLQGICQACGEELGVFFKDLGDRLTTILNEALVEHNPLLEPIQLQKETTQLLSFIKDMAASTGYRRLYQNQNNKITGKDFSKERITILYDPIFPWYIPLLATKPEQVQYNDVVTYFISDRMDTKKKKAKEHKVLSIADIEASLLHDPAHYGDEDGDDYIDDSEDVW